MSSWCIVDYRLSWGLKSLGVSFINSNVENVRAFGMAFALLVLMREQWHAECKQGTQKQVLLYTQVASTPYSAFDE